MKTINSKKMDLSADEKSEIQDIHDYYYPNYKADIQGRFMGATKILNNLGPLLVIASIPLSVFAKTVWAGSAMFAAGLATKLWPKYIERLADKAIARNIASGELINDYEHRYAKYITDPEYNRDHHLQVLSSLREKFNVKATTGLYPSMHPEAIRASWNEVFAQEKSATATKSSPPAPQNDK